ncbi:MAG TPA: DnaT-like ssDNA-binding domain-containing protein [Pseudomonadales bacterium]|nr:DnaT-like ssDNA-binding domain-containing protein [Pseudomonadales bacterium]
MSLLPETPIAIPPSLAATLGLEEAALLVVLQECMRHSDLQQQQQRDWLTISRDRLLSLVPFWTDADVQRVLQNLRDKGVIHVDSPPFTQANFLRVAFDIPSRMPPTPAPSVNINHVPANQGIGGSRLIPPNWQPPDSILQTLKQFNGIDIAFAESQVAPFVVYWTEKRATAASWSNKFRSWVLREWRDRESDYLKPSNDIPMPMYREWQPSRDALEILNKSGISQAFIEDCVPEFVLYWQERGEALKTWNTKFIQHIRNQWERYTNATRFDSEPRRIDAQWQPSNDVYDVLTFANIDIDFARQLVPEFVMYWRESNRVQSSWNSKFLQHVKYRWAQRHHMPNALSTGQQHEKHRSFGQRGEQKSDIIERLVDRSWAQS